MLLQMGRIGYIDWVERAPRVLLLLLLSDLGCQDIESRTDSLYTNKWFCWKANALARCVYSLNRFRLDEKASDDPA